jgi:hypothetical protein
MFSKPETFVGGGDEEEEEREDKEEGKIRRNYVQSKSTTGKATKC